MALPSRNNGQNRHVQHGQVTPPDRVPNRQNQPAPNRQSQARRPQHHVDEPQIPVMPMNDYPDEMDDYGYDDAPSFDGHASMPVYDDDMGEEPMSYDDGSDYSDADDLIGFGDDVDMSDYEIEDDGDYQDDASLQPPVREQADTRRRTPVQQDGRGRHAPSARQQSNPNGGYYDDDIPPARPSNGVRLPHEDDEILSDDEYIQREAEMRKSSEDRIKQRADEDNREERKSRKTVLGKSAKEKSKNDNAVKAKRIRTAVIVGVVLIVLFGAFKTFMPTHEWSADEITTVAKQANGDTGFPMQEGAGIAQQFMAAYLQSRDASSSEILNTFYNGVPFSDSAGTNPNVNGNMQYPANVNQVIKAGPYLYDEQAVTPNGETATYKFGTLVYRLDTSTNQPIMGPDGKIPAYKWLFYQVDVHYDKKTNTFAIGRNSPIRVPEPTTSDATSIPDYQLPGSGEETEGLDDKAMQNLISTFFKAWAASDQASMVNITDGDSLPSVHHGLDGQVVIDGDGRPSFKIYDPPSTDPYYRALVTVNWKEPVGDNGDGFVQTSTYILKLKKAGSKFTVVDVQPYKYIPEDRSDDN